MSSTKIFSSFEARLRGFISDCRDATWGSGIQTCQRGEEFELGGSDEWFGQLALDLFRIQFEHNSVYRSFCEARGIFSAQSQTLRDWKQIPAVPTSAFKELEMSCLPPEERTTVFYSSGTTHQLPSRHFHNASSLAVYEESLQAGFESHFFGDLPWRESSFRKEARLTILTPSPAQAPHSSLVHMFETVRRACGSPERAFFGRATSEGAWTLDFDAVAGALTSAVASHKPLLLLGTAFSFVNLLDWLEERSLRFALPPDSRVLETGGYKGRSRSLPKAELHSLITQKLGIPITQIVCEYGMSELNSQAYARASEGSTPGGPLTLALSPSQGERETDTSKSEQTATSDSLAPAHSARSGPLPLANSFRSFPKPLKSPSEGERGTDGTGVFVFPPWVRVEIVSPENGQPVGEGETGLIRVFDLANVYSAMAVQTEDLGVRRGRGFELIGRAALAEPRGCSLMAI